MISHAMTIVLNEMNGHFEHVYQMPAPVVVLGNLAEGIANNGGNSGVVRDRLILSVINLREEKSLKNVPAFQRDDSQLKIRYQNPPVFLNLMILMTATHSDYSDALLMLSRAISFFQHQNVFTPTTVASSSITNKAPNNELDQLSQFKLIFDLYSPSMEEVNHLWGTLGGKQYPFAMYMLRMVDLQFKSAQREAPQVQELSYGFLHQS